MAPPALRGTFGANVVMDPKALQRFLSGKDGPVYRRLFADGDRVKAEAKRLVGVYRPPPDGPARQRRPGTLRDSIVKRVVEQHGAPVVIVGSGDKVALWHHEGTRPHPIVAKGLTTRTVKARGGGTRQKPGGKAKLLVFYWAKVGRVVAFPRVNHPGTKPNRFLTNALRVLDSSYRIKDNLGGPQ